VDLTKTNFIGRILGLEYYKLKGVVSTFLFRFLYRAVFVIVWTLIVTLFVEEFGILKLPYLFVINSLFTVLASLLYSEFLSRYNHQRVLFAIIFLSAFSILLTTSVFNIDKQLFLFLLILIESVFLIQLKVFLNAQIEGMFSPNEGQKVFPVSESFETLGSILGGFILFYLSNSFATGAFLFFVVIFLISMVPVLLFYEPFSVNYHKKNLKNKILFEEFLKDEIFQNKKKSFVKGLVAIVLLQWFLFNLVEFQYLSGVYQNVSGMIIDSGSGFEHAFIHDLGALFVLFNLSALFCQLLLASKLISSLGIIGSMVIHPIVLLLSFVFYIFNNGFYPILFVKNNFMLSSVVLNNAYHCSFYAIKENSREYLRHFLEGVVRPLGALLGTFFIFAIQFFSPDNFSIVLSIGIIIFSFYFIRVIFSQQNSYFETAFHELKYGETIEIRKEAIEIISQKGGKGYLSLLISFLNKRDEKISIKIKILEVLGKCGQVRVVRFILRTLHDEKLSIRIASANALGEFFNDFKFFNRKYLFFRLEIIETLKDVFKYEKNEYLRVKILNLLTKLSGLSTLEFLMGILRSNNSLLKREALLNLGNYKNTDIESVLSPFFKSGNPNDQISAAIALGKQKKKHRAVLSKIENFIHSKQKEKVVSGIFAIGELKIKNKKQFLLSNLYSHDLRIKMESAIALSKMGYFDSIPVLIELLLSNDLKISKKVKLSLHNSDKKVYFELKKKLYEIVHQKISDFKISLNFTNYSLIDKMSLKKFKFYYSLADDFDEVEIINKFINK
jgi:HEAT repeat protein/MFS family permease